MTDSIDMSEPFTNAQIISHDLPQIATLEYSQLEKNLLKSSIIANIVIFLIPIIIINVLGLVGVDFLRENGIFISIGIGIIMILSILYSYFAYYKKSYALRERDIIYNTGLFWKSSTVIPFNRVQHCEVTQGPIDRFYKLSHLKVFTAGGSSSDLSIEGLSPETANRIKDFIVTKTSMDEEE